MQRDAPAAQGACNSDPQCFTEEEEADYYKGFDLI